jgi:hypothetical protein
VEVRISRNGKEDMREVEVRMMNLQYGSFVSLAYYLLG